eukprot:6178005-Pleurochrysis_carterae.AAC.1
MCMISRAKGCTARLGPPASPDPMVRSCAVMTIATSQALHCGGSRGSSRAHEIRHIIIQFLVSRILIH